MNFKATVVILIFIIVILLSGCGQNINTNSGSSLVLRSAALTIQKKDSVPESSSATEPSDAVDYFESAEKNVIGNKTYYLDERETMTIENTTGYMLYYRYNTNGTNTTVNILAYSIASYGDYIYVLTSNNGDFQSSLSSEMIQSIV